MNQTVSVLALGWRGLWRDARAGELRLLMLAVLLAVAALACVSFFADRLQGGLQRDARQLLVAGQGAGARPADGADAEFRDDGARA